MRSYRLGYFPGLLAQSANYFLVCMLAWVSIPQRPAVESLNVAVAAAVCLFEQLRQREAPPGPHQG